MAQTLNGLNKNFGRQLDKYLKNVQKTGTKEIRGVGLKSLSLVMTKSPVDFGTFRGNWKVGINSIDSKINYGRLEGTARREGESRIGSIKSGERINISNALPYAMRLEYGYSNQAPSGMVRTTLNELIFWLKSKNKKV
jgi:hypothetical protein